MTENNQSLNDSASADESMQDVYRANYLSELILELSNQVQKTKCHASQYEFKHTAEALQNAINSVLMCSNSIRQDLADKKEAIDKKNIIIG